MKVKGLSILKLLQNMFRGAMGKKKKTTNHHKFPHEIPGQGKVQLGN